MITISISLSWVDPSPHPTFHDGLHHVAEVMPAVLASYGLSMPGDPAVAASEMVMGVMIDALEAALAS
jgi:hypothetical protein